MISTREIVAALYGAYRLARADAAGLSFFDVTVAGFWRSFFAAALVAPFYLILLMIRYGEMSETVPLVRFLAIETIAYVIAWLAFPVVMATVVKAMDRDAYFIRYIVAYNWAAVLQNGLYLPIAIGATAGLLGQAPATALGLAALGLILVYTWFITKAALDVPSGTAAGIVGLDFLLSVFINAVADGML